MDDYSELPQYTGSFLFLFDLSKTFSRCNLARDNNNMQILLRNVEAAALGLAGYYDEETKDKIIASIKDIRRDVDKIVRTYEEGEELQIPEPLYNKFFELEYLLRSIWKDSGLQMSMRIKDQLEDW
jgi:hypothetical protein